MDAWRCLFDDEEHLESRAFPPLHKIILGLASLDLQAQLNLSTAGINEKDADGRTALSWAATRGDLRSVSLLLQYRANPNLASLRGQTPLHWASQNSTGQSAQILQVLIDAGSDVNRIDYWKRTALIYASCNQDDPRCLEVLVNGGANLNSQDCHQRSPLGYAAKMGKFEGLKYLLSAGADARLADIWGFPPLFEALQHNHHECLRSLLQQGPVPSLVDINGMSALHIAALYSDVKSLDIFAGYGIEQARIEALDKNGMTAQELFNQREDATVEHSDAFMRLTQSASQFPGPEHEFSDEETVPNEKFVDAIEYLDGNNTRGGH